ncbi:MAG: hypothetical protein KF867_03630 [Cryobacterium sp.]|nr:hypothetical protein [Cryobacterium sp.]
MPPGHGNHRYWRTSVAYGIPTHTEPTHEQESRSASGRAVLGTATEDRRGEATADGERHRRWRGFDQRPRGVARVGALTVVGSSVFAGRGGRAARDLSPGPAGDVTSDVTVQW